MKRQDNFADAGDGDEGLETALQLIPASCFQENDRTVEMCFCSFMDLSLTLEELRARALEGIRAVQGHTRAMTQNVGRNVDSHAL